MPETMAKNLSDFLVTVGFLCIALNRVTFGSTVRGCQSPIAMKVHTSHSKATCGTAIYLKGPSPEESHPMAWYRMKGAAYLRGNISWAVGPEYHGRDP